MSAALKYSSGEKYVNLIVRNFMLEKNINCSPLYCAYEIKCNSCTSTYIGEATNLRSSYNLNKQHVRENKLFGVHINYFSGGTFK